MRARQLSRLQRMEEQFAIAPPTTDALEEALATFRATGQLPETQQLAAAVIESVLLENARVEDCVSLETSIENLIRLLDQIDAGELPPPEPKAIRKQLLQAAAQASDAVQKQARLALTILVAAGKDPSDPCLLDGADVPEAVMTMITEVCRAYSVEQHASAQRVGPPVPEAKALVAGMRKYVEIARELGLKK